MHLHKNPHCFKLAALHIKQHMQAGAKLLQLENDRELVDCQPWDDEEDEAVNQVDATIDKGTNVNGAINQPSCTYSESPHEAALRFGIRFTNEQFYDTKLLKLLSDANPHVRRLAEAVRDAEAREPPSGLKATLRTED